MYKDLVSVAKEASTGKIKVTSLVYKVTAVECSSSPLFPMEHPQNFCFISIDLLKRHVALLYHASDDYY